jgi:hypothetical protein
MTVGKILPLATFFLVFLEEILYLNIVSFHSPPTNTYITAFSGFGNKVAILTW